MFKKSRRELIIFGDSPNRVDIGVDEYDILLTPKYYIVKREKIPVKFPFQAKKLAPSVLSDFIDSDSMSYIVYKDGDEWVFIAYNLQEIIDTAKEKGIDPSKVRSIYFAEQIRNKLSKPICVSKYSALALIDGLVTLIPKALTGKDGCKSLDKYALKPQKAYLSGLLKSSSISTRDTIIIVIAILLISLSMVIEGVRYSKAIKMENQKLIDASDGDPVMESEISRRNILNKYRKIDKREREIRDTLKKIGSILNSYVELLSFESNEKGYIARLRIIDRKFLKISKTKADNKGLKYQIQGNIMIITGRWR